MSYTEEAALIECAGETLVAILAQPDLPADTGVVIIVGGPQYRAGSHRQFVHLARALAAAGYPVVRFDYRGMGDSSGDPRDFLAVGADIASAIDFLHARVPQVKNIVLWGLCDGASAALLYCHATQDRRVTGLCLLNPWVRSEVSLAKTQVKHYYTQRLRQKEFWIKLLSGKVARSAAGDLIHRARTAFSRPASNAAGPGDGNFQADMAKGWRLFGGPVLLLLSGQDYTAKEFTEYTSESTAWSDAFKRPCLSRVDIAEADHTFSRRADQAEVEARTLAWLVASSRPSD